MRLLLTLLSSFAIVSFAIISMFVLLPAVVVTFIYALIKGEI